MCDGVTAERAAMREERGGCVPASLKASLSMDFSSLPLSPRLGGVSMMVSSVAPIFDLILM
jgi:hypothetical protein